MSVSLGEHRLTVPTFRLIGAIILCSRFALLRVARTHQGECRRGRRFRTNVIGHFFGFAVARARRCVRSGLAALVGRPLALKLRLLHLPVPSGPLHSLHGSITLHVRPRSVVDERKLEQRTEHKALAHLEGSANRIPKSRERVVGPRKTENFPSEKPPKLYHFSAWFLRTCALKHWTARTAQEPRV